MDSQLLQKYNIPVPRYTSYPPVPYWDDSIDVDQWKSVFSSQVAKGNREDGISLYIHLPFCESLCSYCGCNKKITTNHSVEDVYIDALLKEWDMYLSLMNEWPVIRELHLGGGTPTFFSAANLEKLLSGIFSKAMIHPQHEFSFEGHPNNTTLLQLQTLYRLGFRRVSYGVQDMDPEVQRVISRIQPIENVQTAVENARQAGYHSVNFDLIYGLPLQTADTMRRTIEQTIALKPDRIAFYSYAHVPWTSRGQRLFDEKDLPSTGEKMKLYQLGKDMFTAKGYREIGMDHFALPNEDLYIAKQEGRLHRNFMGYTTQHTSMLIGLGVSSISDAGSAYAQNEKTLHNYYAAIDKNEFPLTKGYFLTTEDIHCKNYTLDIICKGNTVFNKEDIPMLKKYSFPELTSLEADGLIQWSERGLQLTVTGDHFVRNVCSAFDMFLQQKKLAGEKPKFSKAV